MNDTIVQPPGAPSAARPPAPILQFRFHGEGGEYFRIWIVNVLLTIVTLGIYSAWAKVRRLRYFYGNTRLDDVPFQYTGDPIAILKGRLLVYGFLGFYVAMGKILPGMQLVLMLVFLGVLPWLIVKALGFTARNSVFLGLRFKFSGTYGEALRVFILWPILIAFTLGLIFPYIQAKQKRFVLENHGFGTTRFAFFATARQFYSIYAVVFLAYFLLFVAIGIFIAIVDKPSPKSSNGLFVAGMVLAILGFYAGFLIAFAYVRAKVTNLVFNNSALGPHRFESTLEFGPLLWIYFSNLLLIACTVGLYMPWAKVRTAHYVANNTRVRVGGSLDDFVAEQTHAVEATGGEFADALDIDLSL